MLKKGDEIGLRVWNMSIQVSFVRRAVFQTVPLMCRLLILFDSLNTWTGIWESAVIEIMLYHTSHGSVSVVRKNDLQSLCEKANFDPQPTQKPWTDRHQIWMAWLRRGRLPPKN